MTAQDMAVYENELFWELPMLVSTAILGLVIILVVIFQFFKSEKVLEEYEVSAIYVYPVKSCKGTSVASQEIDKNGFKADRQWLVVTEAEGGMVTQRHKSKMALIKPELPSDSSTALILRAPEMPDIAVPIVKKDKRSEMDVFVWGAHIIGIDQGDEVGEWLTKFLDSEDEPLRLVRFKEGYVRPTDPAFAPGYQTGFADGFPFLCASEASLDDLNARLSGDVPMDRFRPNIVVKGCKPFAEDSWAKLKIGKIPMKIVKPCSRCKIPMIDQNTGDKGSESVTETLQKFRTGEELNLQNPKWKNEVFFGQNVVHDKNSGRISVGDKVQIIKFK
mmetsp:Transcript_33916/g.44739  ORF Transcript_33916/g.44739 Transcript_33916/m.44739 type:complete len:332 (+) Transcript_33916:57-1052(+)